MGQELLSWAQLAEHDHYLGIELYQPGVGALLAGLQTLDLDNVLSIERPAQVVLQALPERSVAAIRIFFPDPWPKKRHHKRRLIQPDFVAQIARVLKPAATVHLATDWQPYAEWMAECSAESELLEQDLASQAEAREAPRATKFERRGLRHGHQITDLIYRKLATTVSR